jgi:putative Holliday junction resolvase
MARLMGLDVGEKTIGVAMSDELQIIVSPYETIRRTASIKADLREVQRLVEEFEVAKVIIGNPVMLSGEEAIQVKKVREFAERLARRLKVPVELWDERLTTVQAGRILKEAGKTREERKKLIDSVAASIILKSYMEAHDEG